MLKINALKIFILSIFVCCCSASFAQGKNFTISKTEPNWLRKVKRVDKKPSFKDIQEGYYLYLFEKQSNLETKENYTHFIRDISSSSGVQNGSEISISYDPSYEQLTFHKLIIWRDNKPMDKLNAQKFKIIQKEKELSRFIYSGLFTAYLILDDIRKGDRIEYSFTIKGNNPAFTKYSNIIYFEYESQIVNLYSNIIFDGKRKIQTKNFNDVPPVKQTRDGDLNVFEWQSSMTKTHPNNENEPSDYDPYARVQLSEYQSWKEIVDWGLNLKNYDLKNSKIINDKIAELKVKSKGNKQKYFELATRFVQDEIRYMGIEIGEYSHRPNTPEKILQQRYGDCKDKSTLLCYLLNADGINAYSVFLNTYMEKSTSQLLPSPTVFNHEVIMAEVDDRTIFVDPTMSDQRGPILSNYFPYNANVLVIKPGVNSLQPTPSQILGKKKSLSVFNLSDTTKGHKSTLKIVTNYSANYADDFRYNLNSDGLDYYEKSYVDYYANIYPGTKLKDPIKIEDNEVENIITVTESYEIENFWTKEDDKKERYIAYFNGDLIQDQIVALKKYRDAPLAINYPITIDQTISVILPYEQRFDPENININTENYRYLFSLHSKLDTLTLTYYFQNFSAQLPESSLNEYIKNRKEMVLSLSYGIYYREYTQNTQSKNINYWLVALTLFAVLLASIATFLVYFRKQNFDLEAIKVVPQIGGWLILVSIGTVISPISILVTILKSGLYNQTNWDNLNNLTRFSAFGYKLAFMFECIGNASLIVFSIFLIFMLFNRRKDFPKAIIFFKVFAFLITLIDVILVSWVSGESSKTDFSNYGYLIGQGIATIIWVLYLINSTRVKATFVFTYPKSLWRAALRKDAAENFGKHNFLNNTSNFGNYTKIESIEEDERL